MDTAESILPGQYRISKRAEGGVPDGFERERISEWTVTADTDFAFRPVVADGERVGAVLGTAIDVRDGARTGDLRLTDVGTGEDTLAAFERRLSDLVGRYIGIVSVSEEARVYTDPIGALPAVYDGDRGFVAASPLSIPTVTHDRDFRGDLFDEMNRRGNSWLPGTITYYSGVSRLLPNHYLDLNDWEATRYWPGEEVEIEQDVGRIVEEMLSELHGIFGALVRRYDRPKMSLTAGKDSRCLLAAARQWVTDYDISLYTFGGDDYALDVDASRQMARENDLDWSLLPVVVAPHHERERFLRRTGYTVSSAVKDIHPTMRDLGAVCGVRHGQRVPHPGEQPHIVINGKTNDQRHRATPEIGPRRAGRRRLLSVVTGESIIYPAVTRAVRGGYPGNERHRREEGARGGGGAAGDGIRGRIHVRLPRRERVRVR